MHQLECNQTYFSPNNIKCEKRKDIYHVQMEVVIVRQNEETTHCSNPEFRIRKKLQEKSEAAIRTPLQRASKRAPTWYSWPLASSYWKWDPGCAKLNFDSDAETQGCAAVHNSIPILIPKTLFRADSDIADLWCTLNSSFFWACHVHIIQPPVGLNGRE